MTILDRYIGRVVGWSSLTVMGVLLAVFAFFEFMDELRTLGQGKYGVLQAVQFVGLSVPRLAYELCPIAALLGSLLGLGSLVSNSEMTVIRASGVSVFSILLSVMRAGVVIVLVAVVLGELILPPSEQMAQELRSVAITEQITMTTRHGFWARDRNTYVNIRKLLPGDRVEHIYIYEFDDHNRLTASTFARSASYKGNQWILEDIRQTIIRTGETLTRRIARASWDSLLNPGLVNMVVIKPNNLSMRELYQYIGFLDTNHQNSLPYRQALWSKLFYPLGAAAMVFLAVPIVLSARVRSIAVGQRIVLGASIALAFYIFNKAMGYLGVVFNIYPAFSVTLPTLLTFGVALLLMRRVS